MTRTVLVLPGPTWPTGVLLALVVAACGAGGTPTQAPGTGHGPGYASIWLTTDPAIPRVSVPVAMTSPDEPDVLFAHTFVPGTPVRGAFATSEGRYRLTAFDGACVADLDLGPSTVTDVLLSFEDGECDLAVVRTGRHEDQSPRPEEHVVLITNHNRGNETPFIEPAASNAP